VCALPERAIKVATSTVILCVDFMNEAHIHIEGQVHVVRLIRLQTDNFHLFLYQQTDKRQTSVCTISKR
jgi:hypothetical protein